MNHRWKTLVRYDLSIAAICRLHVPGPTANNSICIICVFICVHLWLYVSSAVARTAALDRLTAFLAGFSSMDQGWLELLISERWALLAATAAHLDLVIEAVLIAVLVGVPLGILAAPPAAGRAGRGRPGQRAPDGPEPGPAGVPADRLPGPDRQAPGAGGAGRSMPSCRSSRTRSSACRASTPACPRPRWGWG